MKRQDASTHLAPLASLAWLACLAALTAGPGAAAGPASDRTPSPTPGPFRTVLVQADGRGPDVETFFSRFQSELIDRGVSLGDARLSGGRLSVLSEDPPGPDARAFREEWPADAYLGITVDPCETRTRTTTIPDRTPEGYRLDQVIVTVTTSCTARLEAVRAAGGKSLAKLDVKGSASWRQDKGEGAEVDSSVEDALREAAQKAAKKLAPLLKR